MAIPHRRDLEDTRRRLASWIAATKPDARDVRVSEIIGPAATGYSHETLIFDADWTDASGTQQQRSLVARVKPSAHTVFPDDRFDVELRAASVLSEVDGVLVPTVHWHEPDPDVLGAPFFVMDRVEGEIPGDNPPYTGGGWLVDATPEQQATVWWSGFEAMATVHALDPNALDLAFLERDEFGYWESYAAWATADTPLPLAEEALGWLRAHRPPPARPGVCWGDSRLGNQIFRDFRCAALLDWEMAAIGDPEQDLGWWLYFDRLFSEGLGLPRPPGFPSHEETIDRWEQRTGRRARALQFYEVFSAFRFAVILLRVTNLMKVYGQLPQDSDFPVNNFATQMLQRVMDEVAARTSA